MCSRRDYPKLSKKILSHRYYCPTIEQDSADYVKWCKECQLHADVIHVPATHGHFLAQTIETSQNPTFIITITKYYTNWAEAESFVNKKASSVVCFTVKNIIVRFGIPKVFITDNGPHRSLLHKKNVDLCKRSNIELDQL